MPFQPSKSARAQLDLRCWEDGICELTISCSDPSELMDVLRDVMRKRHFRKLAPAIAEMERVDAKVH